MKLDLTRITSEYETLVEYKKLKTLHEKYNFLMRLEKEGKLYEENLLFNEWEKVLGDMTLELYRYLKGTLDESISFKTRYDGSYTIVFKNINGEVHFNLMDFYFSVYGISNYQMNSLVHENLEVKESGSIQVDTLTALNTLLKKKDDLCKPNIFKRKDKKTKEIDLVKEEIFELLIKSEEETTNFISKKVLVANEIIEKEFELVVLLSEKVKDWVMEVETQGVIDEFPNIRVQEKELRELHG